MIRLLLIAAVALSLSCATAMQALAAPALFGAEFEFHNAETSATEGISHPVLKKYQLAMREKLEKICAVRRDCRVTSSPRKGLSSMDYVVTYEDGWSFRISTDNGTIEVQTAPATYEEFQEMRDRIQSDIFDVAAECELFPSAEEGAGHVHIGVVSGFNENPLLLRNFIVDRANHPELAMGIFNHDPANAPPISELTVPQKRAFIAVIRDFDEGKITTTVEFARALNKQVYYATPSKWEPAEKYQDANVTRIDQFAYESDRQTLELRGFAAQANADVFLSEILLLQRRIDYLESKDGRVGFGATLLTPETELEAALGFYRFVTETGLPWKDYRSFLPKRIGEARLKEGAATKILPHTPFTKLASEKKYNSRSDTRCAWLFRALGRLSPKNLLFFGY